MQSIKAMETGWPVNTATPLIRPDFYGLLVTVLTGFHCRLNITIMLRVRVRKRIRGRKKMKIGLAQSLVKYQDHEDMVQA